MTFLPIVERELRVASRRRGTYWTRVGAALMAVCAAGFMLAIASLEPYESPSELGWSLFMTLSGFAFLYCLMAGVRNTADCLSEEKRQGTLGLLFLTDLKGYDVVLGKLAATSLSSFYGLLAIFPVLAIPLLLGGMSGVQFWRMALVLLSTLFFSLAAGMYVSSVGHQQRKTVTAAILLILFITAGIPLSGMVYDYYLVEPHRDEPPIFTLLPSPAFAFGLTFDAWRKQGIDPNFWWSLLVVHVLSWAFLGLASAQLPRRWQDKPASIKTMRWRESWKQWSYGGAAERKAFRERLMNVNPFFWLAGRDRLKPAYVWAFLGLAGAGWLWGLAVWKNDWLDQGVCILTALFLHSFLKLWVASEACQRLSEDQQHGALELLLSTPLKVTEILRGQFLALKRQFFYPVVVVLLMDWLFLLAEHADGEWVLMWLAGMVMLVADLYTLSWVSMWEGLKTKDANRATAFAMGRILLLPWVIFYVGAILAESLPGKLFAGSDQSPIIAWFLLGMVIDIFFCARAKRKLRRNFRSVSAQRFEGALPRDRWWRRWSRSVFPT